MGSRHLREGQPYLSQLKWRGLVALPHARIVIHSLSQFIATVGLDLDGLIWS